MLGGGISSSIPGPGGYGVQSSVAEGGLFGVGPQFGGLGYGGLYEGLLGVEPQLGGLGDGGLYEGLPPESQLGGLGYGGLYEGEGLLGVEPQPGPGGVGGGYQATGFIVLGTKSNGTGGPVGSLLGVKVLYMIKVGME